MHPKRRAPKLSSAHFSVTLYSTRAVHTQIKIALTIGHRKSTSTIPAARIDPPETGDGNYA